MRGTNSLRGNNEPLYVVDGIIVSSAGEDVDAVDVSKNKVMSNKSPYKILARADDFGLISLMQYPCVASGSSYT